VATISKPMTFAEFEKLPDCEFRLELRHGQTVEMPPPKHAHYAIQQQLLALLIQAAGGAGRFGTEMGFQLGQRNFRVADVGFVSREVWDAIPPNGYLTRAPELVVEVLSPSNTVEEMRDKRKLCLENGSREFWVVDPVQREVEISTPDGRSIIYKSGQQIPLFFAGERTLAVDAVFE
jgi:Uma2 family endonuclease